MKLQVSVFKGKLGEIGGTSVIVADYLLKAVGRMVAGFEDLVDSFLGDI